MSSQGNVLHKARALENLYREVENYRKREDPPGWSLKEGWLCPGKAEPGERMPSRNDGIRELQAFEVGDLVANSIRRRAAFNITMSRRGVKIQNKV